MNDDVNGTAGVQGGQGGNGHLTHVFSCRIVGGVLQLQCVSTTDLLSILHTHTGVSYSTKVKKASGPAGVTCG